MLPFDFFASNIYTDVISVGAEYWLDTEFKQYLSTSHCVDEAVGKAFIKILQIAETLASSFSMLACLGRVKRYIIYLAKYIIQSIRLF